MLEQLCAPIVCTPFATLWDCQTLDAAPALTGTGFPSAAPSRSKRTAASGDDAVRVTTSAADAPSVGAVIVGVSLGSASGVTEFDGADAGPVPEELVAVTVNVYGVPLVSPLTVIGEAVPVAPALEGEDETVYVVPAGDPYPGVNATLAAPLSGDAATPVGAAGGTFVSQPMSARIPSVTGPGSWIDSCVPIIGVISEFAFPAG